MLPAGDLPTVVKEAVQLELDGHGSEALDRYRAALTTDPTLTQDEAVALPLTVTVLSKAAHLSIDLGYGEEAWDLSGRLLAAKNQAAVEAGTLVRMRLLRLQGKTAAALALYAAYAKDWPQSSPGPGIATEVWRLRTTGGRPGPDDTVLKKPGPAFWAVQGTWAWLPSPGDALGLTVQEAVRLQIGVFKDWNNALTVINMLREKGWSPLTEARTSAAGETLHVIYVISRQPITDKARLAAQGLLP
jgi:hypothetical protein